MPKFELKMSLVIVKVINFYLRYRYFGLIESIITEMFLLKLLMLHHYCIGSRTSAFQFYIVKVDFIVIYMFLLVVLLFNYYKIPVFNLK